jgi:hypothetical protein
MVQAARREVDALPLVDATRKRSVLRRLSRRRKEDPSAVTARCGLAAVVRAAAAEVSKSQTSLVVATVPGLREDVWAERWELSERLLGHRW